MAKKVAVVAVGGNSLIPDNQHQSVQDQYAAACETMKHIAEMICKGWDVVITHGNGPQVGYILARSEYSRGFLHEVPSIPAALTRRAPSDTTCRWPWATNSSAGASPNRSPRW